MVDLQGFDDAKHDCTVSLLTGADLSGEEAADVVEDVTLADGTIRRTVTINPAAAIDTYAIKVVGSADVGGRTVPCGRTDRVLAGLTASAGNTKERRRW